MATGRAFFTTPETLGDYVLVHVGFALTVISEEEAEKTLAFLRSMAAPEEIARELEGEEGRPHEIRR